MSTRTNSDTPARRSPSLVRRLWLASILILPIVIGFSSYALNRAYERGLDSAEYEAILSQIYALLAIAEPGNSQIIMPEIMANPRFETPDSGLYARILNEQTEVVWQSNSLESSQLTLTPLTMPAPGKVLDSWVEINAGRYRALSFTTVWEIDNTDYRFSFEVLHSQQEKRKEIQLYQRSLLIWLSGMALILLAFQIAITLWGLRPLKLLAEEIEDIEQGKSQKLIEEYPIEIEPVTASLNKLLISESKQRERYKNSLSDLAHSLKTPLSVIRSQLDSSDKSKAVDEQVQRMSDIISHQLRRASAEVKTIYGPSTQLLPLVRRLLQALQKVYRDKELTASNTISNEIHVSMQEDDCLEVLGNIIENAFKYGNDRIDIQARKENNSTVITVSDNGEGVNEKLASTILQRGARADTSKSGQGIGLAIAADILSSYNGALSVSRSKFGGAEFKITIPD